MAWLVVGGGGEADADAGGGVCGDACRGAYGDGYRVDGLVPAGGGQNNDVFFGRSGRSGAAVVVKIEGIPGRLDAEARALGRLAGRGVPAPRLLHGGRIRAAGDLPGFGARAPVGGRFALVLERLEGRAPGTPDDWRAMGEALARVAAVPLRDAGALTVHEPAAFVAAHEALGRALVAELPPPHGAAVKAALRAGGVPPELSPPVLTHGDPGPGNFLLHGPQGRLLDWETVQAAPAGLDPARASFLALLSAAARSTACAAYAVRAAEARACAAAVWEGWEGPGATVRSCRVSPAARRWWTGVAGLQFVANRWHRRAEPRILPWRDAVATWTAVAEGAAG